MNIETHRLRIVPLTVEQFFLLLHSIGKMEETLKLNPSNEQMDIHTQKAMEGLYKNALEHTENYIWYTNWQIILKAENKSIGSACFMKEPDENGKVEIGYGINSGYRNNGYAGEAIQAMCNWALLQPNVNGIIAKTEKDNYASQKVLQKCGMEKDNESIDTYSWILEK